MRPFQITLTALLALSVAACAGRRGCCNNYPDNPGCPAGVTYALEAERKAAERAPPARLYTGEDGKEADLAAVAGGWGEVDLVAFGELHGHLEGAKAQLTLLKTLAGQPRPLALAMEFFERDTQPALAAYLAGTMDKDSFLKETKRNEAYAATHGPLIDFCKAEGIPVIAANAPRRLVTAYRKFEGDYEAYLASLSGEERGWLPEDTDELDDEYRERFLKLMGKKRGPSFFRSQSLWDDAMAEAMVDFRAEHPNHRVLLIVGGFHVRSGLGTITKYRNRRGKDEVRIIGMEYGRDGRLSFEEDDIGTADLVLKVRPPKRAPRAAKPAGKAVRKAGGAS